MSGIEVFDRLKVNIDIKEVLRVQGYKGGKKPEARVNEILTEEIKEAHQLAKSKAIYREVKVLEEAQDLIKLEGNLILHVGRKAVRWWHGCQSLAIALCTIGRELEERVSALFKESKYAEALILDSAGSVAADGVANQVNQFICQKALNSGMKVGPRLSPGYGKWPLADQRVIFELLPGERIEVYLNEQCMMIPRKSVSFCIGLGTLESFGEINPCRYCDMVDCQYRKIK